jgi:hypothetical protein
MIAENLKALLDLIGSVPALAQSTGIALGGQAPDPSLSKIALPAAWVLHASDKPLDADGSIVPAVQASQFDYVVAIYLPYVSQSDMLAVQLPLLEAVITAVRGQDAPSGHRFAYRGQRITLINPGRITYEQRYSLEAVI